MAKKPAQVAAPINVQVQFTVQGLMIATDGENFSAMEVDVLDLLKKLTDPVAIPEGKKWSECPISVTVEGESVFMTVQGSKAISLYSGPAAAVISQMVRQQWLQINMGLPMPAAAGQPVLVAPLLQQSHAGAAAMATAVPQQGQGTTVPGRWRKWGILAVGAIGLVVAAYFAATKYLYPTGPAMDLSSLSVDEIAALDSNPGAIRDVQSAAIEAMNTGRQIGAQKAAQIEESHVEALKAMGLNPGTSLKNAMGCLAR